MTEVFHFRLEDGRLDEWRKANGAPLVKRGVYCVVYPDNKKEFRAWMRWNCPGAEITYNNWGYSVYVADPAEILIFILKFR